MRAVATLTFALVLGATASSAATAPVVEKYGFKYIDELQIDWVIPAGNFGKHDGKELFRNTPMILELMPKRLFLTNGDVVASDGKKLLGKGAQLYAMIGRKLMGCSQEAAPEGYLGATNRVCLLDTNADGAFDVYFLRGFGKSFFVTDQMWFAINANLPADIPALKPVEFAEVDRAEARQKLAIGIDFTIDKSGHVFTTATLGRGQQFAGGCVLVDGYEKRGEGVPLACFSPDFVVTPRNLAAPKPERKIVVSAPKRDVEVRFDVSSRLLARNMESFYFK